MRPLIDRTTRATGWLQGGPGRWGCGGSAARRRSRGPRPKPGRALALSLASSSRTRLAYSAFCSSSCRSSSRARPRFCGPQGRTRHAPPQRSSSFQHSSSSSFQLSSSFQHPSPAAPAILFLSNREPSSASAPPLRSRPGRALVAASRRPARSAYCALSLSSCCRWERSWRSCSSSWGHGHGVAHTGVTAGGQASTPRKPLTPSTGDPCARCAGPLLESSPRRAHSPLPARSLRPGSGLALQLSLSRLALQLGLQPLQLVLQPRHQRRLLGARLRGGHHSSQAVAGRAPAQRLLKLLHLRLRAAQATSRSASVSQYSKAALEAFALCWCTLLCEWQCLCSREPLRPHLRFQLPHAAVRRRHARRRRALGTRACRNHVRKAALDHFIALSPLCLLTWACAAQGADVREPRIRAPNDARRELLRAPSYCARRLCSC